MENNKKNARMEKVLYKIDDVLRLIDLELYKKGWKRGDLAKALGRGDAWLSRIMSKKRNLSAQTILDIANALDIDPASLLPGHNPEIKIGFEEYLRKVIKKELNNHCEEKHKELEPKQERNEDEK